MWSKHLFPFTFPPLCEKQTKFKLTISTIIALNVNVTQAYSISGKWIRLDVFSFLFNYLFLFLNSIPWERCQNTVDTELKSEKKMKLISFHAGVKTPLLPSNRNLFSLRWKCNQYFSFHVTPEPSVRPEACPWSLRHAREIVPLTASYLRDLLTDTHGHTPLFHYFPFQLHSPLREAQAPRSLAAAAVLDRHQDEDHSATGNYRSKRRKAIKIFL